MQMQLSFKRTPGESKSRTLAELGSGEAATLVDLDLPSDFANRLMELGFLPGGPVFAAFSRWARRHLAGAKDLASRVSGQHRQQARHLAPPQDLARHGVQGAEAVVAANQEPLAIEIDDLLESDDRRRPAA